LAQRSSRKRRKERQRSAQAEGAAVVPPTGHVAEDDAIKRGYARGRAKSDAARAALIPLKPGERPTAVTVGAIVATVLTVAQVVAFLAVVLFDQTIVNVGRNGGAVIAIGLMGVTAYGMWKSRYWAVLGMQALLGITLLYASMAALFALNWRALVLVFLVIIPAGALFWFLVKAMARIQMPERPGANR
jgi:anti-sigma factor RsiW